MKIPRDTCSVLIHGAMVVKQAFIVHRCNSPEQILLQRGEKLPLDKFAMRKSEREAYSKYLSSFKNINSTNNY